MSDSPFGAMPTGPSPWTQAPLPPQNPSRMPMIVAIVVALLALALAAASWFKPAPDATPAAPQYSEQQVTDAKKNLCDAYDTMYRAIQGAGSLSSDDPNQKFMIAMNTRLAFNTAADYLINSANANSATSSDLTDAMRKLATSYQKLVLAHTAQAPQEEIDSISSEIHSAETSVNQACK